MREILQTAVFPSEASSRVPGTGCAGDAERAQNPYLRRSGHILEESNSVARLTNSLDSGGLLWLIWRLL